jgi:hypothetical protein
VPGRDGLSIIEVILLNCGAGQPELAHRTSFMTRAQQQNRDGRNRAAKEPQRAGKEPPPVLSSVVAVAWL